MENHMGMNLKSKWILWTLNLLACADPGILRRLAGWEEFWPLLAYRLAMPLVWGMLWVAFARTYRKSMWNKDSKKQAWIMMLAMFALNVVSVSVAVGRLGNLPVYSLMLIGVYVGKIAERRLF